MTIVHFVGFTDERYWNAVKIWGRPHYIHRGWDMRARREISPDDIVVHAVNDWTDEPRLKSFDDYKEKPAKE